MQRIPGCTLRNLGTAAVSIGEGEYGLEIGGYGGYGGWDEDRGLFANTVWNWNAGTSNGIISCDIHDIGAYGVLLGGGDRKTLTPGNNYVINCDIYRTARIYEQMFPNISIDGVGNRVAHNHLHQNPHSVIMYWGNEHVIELNELDHCVYDSGDSGAIYTGRDPSGAGTVIRHNFIHHIPAWWDFEGIYLDDATSGQKLIGNIVLDVTGSSAKGFKFNGGQYNEAYYNVFVHCDLDIENRNWGDWKWKKRLCEEQPYNRRLTTAIDVTQEPYASKYPKLAKIFESHYYNVFLNTSH